MSRALVIKNADFSSVAVDQVEILNSVPCTGITLSQSSASGTECGDTVQITATLTPQNTTDSVIWTSSNPNVASVSSSGLITINGIGTATITATCGNQSATVSVSQMSLLFTDIVTATGYRMNNYGTIMGLYGNSGSTAIGKQYGNNNKLRIYDAGANIMEAIPVPYGATSATIQITERKYWSYFYVGDMNTIEDYSGNRYPKYVTNYSGFFTDTAREVEFGQCIAISGDDANAALVTGILFQ